MKIKLNSAPAALEFPLKVAKMLIPLTPREAEQLVISCVPACVGHNHDDGVC